MAEWLRAHRQSEQTHRVAVGTSRRRGTESADQRGCRRSVRPRVCRDMFAPDRRASALVLPSTPLDRMYAEPARAFIESRGGQVRTSALARVTTDGIRVTGVQLRDEWIPTGTVISTVPWHQLRTLFEAVPAALTERSTTHRGCIRSRSSRSISGTTASSWRTVRRPPRPLDAVGLRQAARLRRNRVTFVARVERRVDARERSTRSS